MLYIPNLPVPLNLNKSYLHYAESDVRGSYFVRYPQG
jgi:hypothetical protein